jgi:hypothetical protein
MTHNPLKKMSAQNHYTFAVHVLMFDCEKTILRMLDNCGPHVDKIFVTYSSLPWTYNERARKEFKNSTDKNILEKSNFFSKIQLIEGEWETEEDERNNCLKFVKDQNFDFLIIQDADEFYTKEDYQKNLSEIRKQPWYELYQSPVRSFWKNLHYILVNKNETINFAINCNKEIKFKSLRSTNAKKKLKLSGICYHLTTVLTDDEYKKKLAHWGHATKFRQEEWFQKKWLKWNESTKNLHPLTPWHWKKAIRYDGPIPAELEGFEEPIVEQYNKNSYEIFFDKWYDFKRYFSSVFHLGIAAIFIIKENLMTYFS